MTRLSTPRALRTAVGALSRRRRQRLVPALMLMLALGATGGAYATLAPSTTASAAAGPSAATVEQGRALFLKNCATCHGLNAQGGSDGPTLIGVGAASVDFQVGTGRMPAAQLGVQVQAKRPQFTDKQVAQLAAYVASLAPGPSVPSAADVDFSKSDVAAGGQIYRTNCAMCHNFAGKGGALTQGKYAPSLAKTIPRHIYEAMLTGPQSMPVFGDGALKPAEKREVIAFLRSASTESSPSGATLGKIGTVSEGGIAWLLGLGALVGCAVWLGAKAR